MVMDVVAYLFATFPQAPQAVSTLWSFSFNEETQTLTARLFNPKTYCVETRYEMPLPKDWGYFKSPSGIWQHVGPAAEVAELKKRCLKYIDLGARYAEEKRNEMCEDENQHVLEYYRMLWDAAGEDLRVFE